MHHVPFLRTHIVVFAASLVAGCGFTCAGPDEDLLALKGRVETLEKSSEDNRAAADKRLQSLESSLALHKQLLDALVASGGPDRANQPSAATTLRTVDPEIKKRLDVLGVKMLENAVDDENMQALMGSLGELANEYVKKEVKRTKTSRTP